MASLKLTSDENNNLISGLDGNDFISSGAGDDQLFGGEGNGILTAQSGSDILDGGMGNDTVIAGTGGEGNDVLLGGAGADSFIFADGHGVDRIVDFEQGVDVITYLGMSVDDFSDLTLMQTGDHVLISSLFGSVIVNDSLVADFDGSDFSFENSPVNNTSNASKTSGEMAMAPPYEMMAPGSMDDAILF